MILIVFHVEGCPTAVDECLKHLIRLPLMMNTGFPVNRPIDRCSDEVSADLSQTCGVGDADKAVSSLVKRMSPGALGRRRIRGHSR